MAPAIDVIDSSWLAAPADRVAPAIADPANWRRWWPGLCLRVADLRGEKGVQWHVDAVAQERSSGLSGSAEVWLQPAEGGVIAHFFLRLDPAAGAELSGRARERVADLYRRRTKIAFWALGDQLDPARLIRSVSASHPPAP